MKTLTVRLSDELHQQLAAYAKESELSMNQLVKIALRKMIKGEKYE